MKTSAGLLIYRQRNGGREVLLAHPGGPYWARKDLGAWTIPKGEPEPGEAPLAAAVREFREETGLEPPAALHALAPIRQRGGKLVHCWAGEADLDLAEFKAGLFEMEWPPRSGRMARYPEIDRVGYFGREAALAHVLAAQAPLIEAVLALARP